MYAEPEDDSVRCSVKDDGVGFDAAATVEGIGLRQSIRGRVEQVGGTVEVDGNPGRGAEIRLCVPFPRRTLRS